MKFSIILLVGVFVLTSLLSVAEDQTKCFELSLKTPYNRNQSLKFDNNPVRLAKKIGERQINKVRALVDKLPTGPKLEQLVNKIKTLWEKTNSSYYSYYSKISETVTSKKTVINNYADSLKMINYSDIRKTLLQIHDFTSLYKYTLSGYITKLKLTCTIFENYKYFDLKAWGQSQLIKVQENKKLFPKNQILLNIFVSKRGAEILDCINYYIDDMNKLINKMKEWDNILNSFKNFFPYMESCTRYPSASNASSILGNYTIIDEDFRNLLKNLTEKAKIITQNEKCTKEILSLKMKFGKKMVEDKLEADNEIILLSTKMFTAGVFQLSNVSLDL